MQVVLVVLFISRIIFRNDYELASNLQEENTTGLKNTHLLVFSCLKLVLPSMCANRRGENRFLTIPCKNFFPLNGGVC